MYRVLKVALLVQSVGYWIILLSSIMMRCYSLFGGAGPAYFLLGWPSLWLTGLQGVLAYLGFYAIGVLIFAIGLTVSLIKGEREIAAWSFVYLLSAILALAVGWLEVGVKMGFALMLRGLFLPWFG